MGTDAWSRGRGYALLAVSVVLVAGCSPFTVTHPVATPLDMVVTSPAIAGAQAGEVPTGVDLRLELVDGTRVSGYYASSGRLPRERYTPAYESWRIDHPEMPGLGDTVTLVGSGLAIRRVVFDGFGYRTLEFVDPATGARDAVPLDSAATLGRPAAGVVAVTDHALGRVPVWTAMRILGVRDTSIVGLAEIDSIWAPRSPMSTSDRPAPSGWTIGGLPPIAAIPLVLVGTALAFSFIISQALPD